jgi:hypothetical protein
VSTLGGPLDARLKLKVRIRERAAAHGWNGLDCRAANVLDGLDMHKGVAVHLDCRTHWMLPGCKLDNTDKLWSLQQSVKQRLQD